MNNDGGDVERKTQELSIEKACAEYNNSVRLTLTLINHQLDEGLLKNYEGLEELSEKIQARTSFLENNPTFLSCLTYNTNDVKTEPLKEFDDVRLTLKEHSKRIAEKLEEIERYHQKLFDLVTISNRASKSEAIIRNTLDREEDAFEDCLDNVIKSKENFKAETPDEVIKNKATFDKVIIQKNAYSDITLGTARTADRPAKFQLFPDLPADVQRRKPSEDLHGKLIQQLEASDSLEGFLKLMDRKPSKRKNKQKKGDIIEQKYTGSLWFFPHKGVKRKMSKNTLPSSASSQRSAKIARLCGTGSALSRSAASTCCSLLVTSSQAPLTNQDRTRKIKENLERSKLKYYDLLDDLDGKDLKPIKSEYPRRDNIYGKEGHKLHAAKTYLHRMMEENDRVWRKLLQPVSLKPEIKRAKKNVKKLMDYLTAPEQKFLDHRPQSLIVMPVKVVYDNFPTKEVTVLHEARPPLITDLTKAPESPKKSPRVPPINLKGDKRTDRRPVSPTAKNSSRQPRTDLTKTPEDDRKNKMLDHLRGLKARNDDIQKNIQKAIDVIETKMIDLLSSPTGSTDSEAFNAMEMEITNVLKMINDSEKEGEKKVEKVEAEKDENHNKSPDNAPKLRRGLTMVRKTAASPADFVPGVDLVPEDEAKPKKTPEKPKAKIAANIEEGERLLGQVDSVIKKIDSIYTKFHDEGKPKATMKKENSFNHNHIIDFFDGLKSITAESPVEIRYKCYENISRKFQEATSHCRAIVYHEARLEYPPPKNFSERGDFVALPQVQEATARSDDDDDDNEYEMSHKSTLKTFYTIFFSSIFVALNFDYVS
ncbi:hypothetical protein BDFB_000588 [Asbolus verrucosus]|uniref:Uncharacterized protein n=1 Tax=Asbolus verrucosus TaxID=1661398 RepID=A0A482WB46_ASBVE|nr:hypothetical protein BDFB_000588 [Asbolus verrucosus]